MPAYLWARAELEKDTLPGFSGEVFVAEANSAHASATSLLAFLWNRGHPAVRAEQLDHIWEDSTLPTSPKEHGPVWFIIHHPDSGSYDRFYGVCAMGEGLWFTLPHYGQFYRSLVRYVVELHIADWVTIDRGWYRKVGPLGGVTLYWTQTDAEMVGQAFVMMGLAVDFAIYKRKGPAVELVQGKGK